TLVAISWAAGFGCVDRSLNTVLSMSCTQCGNAGPNTPIEYGRLQLSIQLGATDTPIAIRIATIDEPGVEQRLSARSVALDSRPESYAIGPGADEILVVGRDQVGAMYGAFELGERARMTGAMPSEVITGAPAVPIRGSNLFLVLPVRSETQWWFLDL